jgi:hypothetical protein
LAVARSQTALGAFRRRLAARCGKPKVHIATARKLADLFCRSVRYGIGTDDPGAARYEEKQKRDAITNLAKRANKLGFKLVEALQSSTLESLVVSGVT